MEETEVTENKRKHRRVRTMKRVKAVISDQELDALLHDISGGGAALGVEFIAHPDDTVEVKIDGLGSVLGKVVRPTDSGIAMRFVDIDVDMERSLSRYVEKLEEE